MNLVDVYHCKDSKSILWNLLLERDPNVNISHKAMPTWEEHCAFVRSKPYREWYIVANDEGKAVGSCYLSKQNELGVFIFKRHQHQGYGSFALNALMFRHSDERLLANINPRNITSIVMFQHLGFKLCQHTFELQAQPYQLRDSEVV
jgi:RimJ/RimL family protein N-acetyltransferase